jgi:hypothetical protein
MTRGSQLAAKAAVGESVSSPPLGAHEAHAQSAPDAPPSALPSLTVAVFGSGRGVARGAPTRTREHIGGGTLAQ